MSAIFGNYLFQQEREARIAHTDSSLKKIDDLFKSSFPEQDTSLFEKTDFHSFETSRNALYRRLSKKKEHKQGKRYSLAFKQKAINEVHLGKRKGQVAKNYNICYWTLLDWIKKASQPNRVKTKEHQEGRRYPLEFKQKIVTEICSGRRATEVCRSYRICQGSLNSWMKKAYAPNLPYNSSAAWRDSKLNKISKSLYST